MSGLPSGDGFIDCSDGRRRWGLFGAAGVVWTLRDDDVPEILLQLRSAMAHEGGTWSCPGGAIDGGESPLEAALRESREEIGAAPEPWTVLGQHVFEPADDWHYTTFVISVTERFGSSMNFETDDVSWVPVDEVHNRLLHAGFASTWPAVRAIIR